MTWLQSIIIAIVEGVTEFLPISSTAHMIFTAALMDIHTDEFVKMFEVSIQFGAIMAVVFLYWRKFFDFSKWQFYIKLAFAVVPALVLGFLLNDLIDNVLEKPLPIAIVLILGGVVLLFVDNWFKNPRIHREDDIRIPRALIIGLWQCLALMPGMSRAAASIIGGMQQKLDRKLATDFAFFLAVPTMLAVTTYSVFLKDWTIGGVETKGFQMLLASKETMMMFIAGNITAFVVAVLAIKFFISFLKKYGFRFWGFYRIIVGLLIITLIFTGYIGH